MNSLINKTIARNVNFSNVKITDKFFGYYQDLIINEVIPYQWKVLNDELEGVEKSSAINNFKIAAKELEGKFYGFIFQDSDVYKWIEAVGYSLHLRRDLVLEECTDKVIDLIGRAQQEDGYIHTYFIIERPDLKFKNLWECHELYCAGHFFEAAVAYYNATGKKQIIEIAKKWADCIDNNFGSEEGKIKGYDGHEEVELGLMALYSVTKEKRYLNLAKFFIDERGKSPYFFNREWEERGRTSYWNGWKECNAPCDENGKGGEYNQSYKPIKDQNEAVGHAVRVVYMLCGIADVAREAQDKELLEICNRLWNNIVNQKMYITGAIGSTHIGEAFAGNYDLPNDYIYGETCASIGLAMASKRMMNTEMNSKYAEIIEKEIYNGIISGIAMDGKAFFYVNPLEVYPKNHSNPVYDQVKIERQKWYPCACCPPNIARFLLNIGDYIYSADNNTIYMNQYIGNEAKVRIGNEEVNIKIDSNVLHSKCIEIDVSSESLVNKSVAIRVPQWCESYRLVVSDETCSCELRNEYIYIENIAKNNIKINISFESIPKLMKASSKVRHDAGKVALMYGPVVYCLEEIDNGEMIYNLLIDSIQNYKIEKFIHNGLELNSILVNGIREVDNNESLYHQCNIKKEEKEIKFVPYHYWGNRGVGEMQVWVRVK